MLAMIKASLSADAQLVDETGLNQNRDIMLDNEQDPNGPRIFAIHGTVKAPTGKVYKFDEWAGDLWDRRTSPHYWDDQNPQAGDTRTHGSIPPGGPYICYHAEADVSSDPNDVPDCDLRWQAAPSEVVL